MVLVDTPTPLPTNSMSFARGTHTATLLTDGRLLIAGGDDGSGRLEAITDTVELYDPSTGRWEPAEIMGRQRTQHAALPLNDGRILLVGGAGVLQAKIDEQRMDQPLVETDVFDPASGSWSYAGEISTPRDHLAASLLTDGSVLIVGGNDGSGTDTSVLASAEVFDPATGQWSTAGSMSQPRQGHSVVSLKNGAALVAGGDVGEDPFQSVEIYDPSSGTWSKADDMSDARERFAAIVLQDGKVLVVGGGGTSGHLASAELYDSGSSTWSSTAEMSTPRLKPTAVTLQDGRILIVGGLGSGQFLSTAEVYDPDAGTWSDAGSMETGRGFHAATVIDDGRVVVTGGFGFSGPLDSTEIYDPDTNSWSVADPS
jgi:N-acetylneuraminic acid mutarotase